MSQAGSATGGGGGGGGTPINTLTGNTGGAVGPTGGNINVVGSGVVSVAGNPGTSTLTISASGAIASSFPTDSGTAVPSSGVLDILGGSNINTAGATNVVTVNLDDTVSISGSMTAGTGFEATTGDVIIDAGNLDLPPTNTIGTQGAININGSRYFSSDGVSGTGLCVGQDAGNPAVDMGSSVAVGMFALANMNASAVGNVALGAGALQFSTSAASNTALGLNSLISLDSGGSNIAIGNNSGSAYVTTESFNIAIGTAGSTGESNVMRLGDNGVLTAAFIGGAYGMTPSMSINMMTIGSDGQVGSQAIPGGGGITTLDGDTGSATGSTVTIAGGSNINTSATGSTLTVNLDDTVSISGSMTAGTGFTATTGDVTITAGNINLPALGGGGTEGVINVGGAPALYMYNDGTYLGLGVGNTTTAGTNNVAIGSGCMVPVTGSGNVGVGTESFFDILGGNDNTGIGQFALSGITTGSHNVALGFNSGALYLSSESSNICIGTLGVTGDNDTIRLGDPATQTSTFIAGVYGVTPAMSPQMATIGSDGQMGSQAIPGGGGFTWNNVTGSGGGTTNMVAGNGYIQSTTPAPQSFLLPATSSVGDVVAVSCSDVTGSVGAPIITLNTGQFIYFTDPTGSTSSTTVGPGGNLAFGGGLGGVIMTVQLLCIIANTTWSVSFCTGLPTLN